MKKTFANITALSIFFAIFTNSAIANTREIPADTTLEAVLNASVNKENVVILKEANIIYPEIFTGNENQSLEYIENFSSKRKEYLIRTYNKSKKLFPKAETILRQYNVPEEFKVLLALESGFNANAVSSAGAVGYWQFMDNVAKEYGLKIPRKVRIESRKRKGKHRKAIVKTIGVDERKNFNKSTIAAARYLKDRGRNLSNDWLLIAASYNCGVGNVWNAMEKCGKKSPTFWDIKNLLPAETRAYVMNFITLNVIFNNYEAFTTNTLNFRNVTCNAQPIDADIDHDADDYLGESCMATCK